MSEIKQGYKQTKVGIIPEDWEIVKLGKLTTVETGKTPLRSNKQFWDNGTINWATTTEVNETYIVSTNEKITNQAVAELKMKILPINTILLAMYGQGKTRGKVALLRIESTINQAFASIKPNKNYSTNFIFNYLDKSYEKIRDLSHGSNQDNLNLDIVKALQIPLPPLKEQEKIAEILTTWDEAITKQEELLEAKELLKIALMQKLLSGEVRFGGFTDEWEEVRLGEIGNSFNGLSGKTGEDFGIGEAKYITYKNIFDYSKIKLDIFENVQISNDEKQNLVQFGDIFFTVSSETPEEVGMSSVLLDNVSNTYLNSFCFGYRLNNFNTLDPYFARFYFRSFQMRDKISRLAQGSTRFNLSKNEIMKLKIKLPSLPEQQKIAEVLSLADDEINLLKNELEELKQQKKSTYAKATNWTSEG